MKLAILFILININCIIAQNIWTNDNAIQHLQNRQDSLTWDYNLLNRDIADSKIPSDEPMRFGAFPVPKYNLLGENGFNGVVVGANNINHTGSSKHFLYGTFGAKKNRFNNNFIIDKNSEMFFTIIVLSDIEIDTINYSHMGVHISSRNNPDFVGEGFIKTKQNKIDFIAFLTADRNEYAIVNMRLFDLKFGGIILIAPQKDGSLRSMQVAKPVFSLEESGDLVKEVLKEKYVVEFFNSEGVIE